MIEDVICHYVISLPNAVAMAKLSSSPIKVTTTIPVAIFDIVSPKPIVSFVPGISIVNVGTWKHGKPPGVSGVSVNGQSLFGIDVSVSKYAKTEERTTTTALRAKI